MNPKLHPRDLAAGSRLQEVPEARILVAGFHAHRVSGFPKAEKPETTTAAAGAPTPSVYSLRSYTVISPHASKKKTALAMY